MFIDFGSRLIQIKIVFYGPAMSGKTTALEFLFKKFNSQLISLNTSHSEEARTLFYDFGYIILNIGQWGLKINLWSATGQDFYCMTRSTVLQGTDGLIFMADSQKQFINDNIKSFKELKDFFGSKLEANIPVVICLNKRDLTHVISLEEFKLAFSGLTNSRIFETIAREEGKNIFDSFYYLFKQILELHEDIHNTIQKEINFV
ncbi:MAG: GTP-binding protein [Candidatus Helarchaeota archaeon]